MGGSVGGQAGSRPVEEKEDDEDDESVIHDITGTTVYVVGVICVIPAAGLVAWVVRYLVKRKDLNSAETGSGLNCPINPGAPLGAQEEDFLQISSTGTNNNNGYVRAVWWVGSWMS